MDPNDVGGSYDVAILGSGIAGSTTALALAGSGFSVLVVERASHPRFAIGESIVPTTTLGFDHLARRSGVPELAQLCSYPELKRLGCGAWPKQHFWFGHHRAGEPLRPGDQLMFESLGLPRGPDVHLLRSDTDAHLVSLFEKYGVAYLDHTAMTRFEPRVDRVALDLDSEGTVRRVEVKLVVDCTGPGSPLARRFGLRDREPSLRTDTRAIFGHFRGVHPVEDVLEAPDPAFRFRRDAGTIHHAFDGGWIWVIRFDNGVASVGTVLDRARYPLDERVSPEAELRAIVERFPTVAAHLGEMEPTRPIARTDRLQFSSRRISGPGFVLSPHAAAFVDPLFSSGILFGVAFSIRLVALARGLLRRADYTLALAEAELRPLEEAFRLELEQVDRVVSGMTASLRSHAVMKQYFRCWVVSSYLQYAIWAGGGIERMEAGGLIYGAGVARWRDVVRTMDETVLGWTGDSDGLAHELKGIMDALPPEDPARFPVQSDRPCVLRANDRPYAARWVRHLGQESVGPEIRSWRLRAYGLETARRWARLHARVRWSRLTGGRLHPAVDFVRDLRMRDEAASPGD